MHKSMGLDGIHPRALRELVEVLTEPLFIIYQQSQQTGEVPADWRFSKKTLYKKGWRTDLGNYSLTLVPGKVMGQIMLSVITQGNQGLRPSQDRFRKGRSYLINLACFYSKVTSLVDEGKAVDMSTCTLVKPLTLSMRNWLLMAWTGTPFTGLRTGWMSGPREWWGGMVLNLVGDWSLVFPKAQSWASPV
ncbi:rna-directed dna polymerase from mobile element jockey-like [Pitangus sulphuratus]|nr:rna-directed dna polymerase from mobile element jockey-like [Pitangus sulphuratus]